MWPGEGRGRERGQFLRKASPTAGGSSEGCWEGWRRKPQGSLGHLQFLMCPLSHRKPLKVSSLPGVSISRGWGRGVSTGDGGGADLITFTSEKITLGASEKRGEGSYLA